MDPATHRRVTSLVQEYVDWPFLFEMASNNGVLALLFLNLNKICPDSIPPPFSTRLPKFFHVHSLRNQFLAQELIALLHHFEKSGIPAIPFKGPALAAMAYGDLSLREFVDLDVLTQQQHLSKAYEVLGSMGYRRRGENNGRQEKAPEANDYHTFVRGTGVGQVIVDLQCVIKEGQFSFNIDREEVWTNRTEVLLAETRVPSLRAEDLLLILCVHGSKHLWEKLKWVCDVAELVRTYEQNMDWQLVKVQANQYGVRPMLELGLALAHDLVTSPALEKALTHVHLSNPMILAMTHHVGQQMFLQKAHQPGNFERAAFYLSLRDRIPDRMRYYCFLILQPQSKNGWNLLPHPFLFRLFYYCLLPLRLAIKHGLQSPKMKKAIVQWLEAIR
jgi:hypothetical protein